MTTRPPRSTPAELRSLLGCSEDEAHAAIQKAGYVARVTWRDGIAVPVMRDMRQDRINLQLEWNTVLAAYYG